MLIYKQRYKPRTSRAFTKSDLTVYDSAGNTALNALTVYGKSEVVNNEIVSAGEGYAVVDLGSLTWTKGNATNGYFYSQVSGIKQALQADILPNWICNKYNITTSRANQYWEITTENKVIGTRQTTEYVCIVDNDYATAEATDFKTAMNGVKLVYELADPTQGNAIAVKTDNGSGIDGTMAVFETGTPLRGIPDTDVQDVMVWDGSAGTVTKNCGEVDLGTLTWSLWNNLFYTGVAGRKPGKLNLVCEKYPTVTYLSDKYCIGNNDNNIVYVKDTDYTDPADFKTAMSGVKLIYELASPTTEQLTTAENASIAGLRIFAPQTHAQNNAQTDMTVDYTIRVPTI